MSLLYSAVHCVDKNIISYTELCSVPVIGFISREEISNEGVARVRYLLLRDMNPITGTDHSSV